VTPRCRSISSIDQIYRSGAVQIVAPSVDSGYVSRSTRLPEWVAQHPIGWGAITGAFLAVVALFLAGGKYVFLWLVSGAAFGVANWFIWRPGGPAHTCRARIVERFPPRS
jgi:hypothetical protein